MNENTNLRKFRVTCDQRAAYVKLPGLSGTIEWFDTLDAAVDFLYQRFFDRVNDDACAAADGVADEAAWRKASAEAEAKIVDDIRKYRSYDDGNGRIWRIEENGVDFGDDEEEVG